MQTQNPIAALHVKKMIVGGAKWSKSLEHSLLKQENGGIYKTYGGRPLPLLPCKKE
jgi:hypothetical protein